MTSLFGARTAALGACLLASACAAPAPAQTTSPTATPSASGSVQAATAGTAPRVTLGVGMSLDDLRDPELTRLVKGTFTSTTPTTEMKWAFLQPSPGGYDFATSDAYLAQATAEGMRVRGHTLMWYAVPSWVTQQATTCDEAREILKSHITTVVGHYRGQIPEWDVVNEPFDSNGQPRQEDPFLRACGTSIIADAFRWAHEADPDAVLFLNDYSTLASGPKFDAQLQLVKTLREQDVPIDAVGFQAHETLSGLDPNSAKNLRATTDLGVKVAFTEADVRMQKQGDSPTSKQVEQQRAVYQGLADLCVGNSACTGFTVWSPSDRSAWVREALPGWDFQGISDSNLAKRPSWDAVVKTLQKAS